MFKLPKAYAHCDIPCKIYDPAAQYAVLSVIRIIDLLKEIEESPSDKSINLTKRRACQNS